MKTTFLLMMKILKTKKPYTSSLSSRAGRKDYFEKHEETNKCII